MDDITEVSKINSCQNGFLLREHIHSLFNQYLVSVNPDISLSPVYLISKILLTDLTTQ